MDKYSTIQQHEPLRVPSSFNKEERGLIVQLEQILDDIYRRFGRLRLEDLGPKLQMVVEDKYGKVNGIYVTEDGIDIESNAGENMHIRLESGTSVVLIDPTQINMNTEGLVSILGKENSIIKLVGGTDNIETIFQADSSGVVQAKDVESEEVNAGTVTVGDLNVTGEVTGDFGVPNIVVSSTQPESGNNTIWLEPSQTTTAEPFSIKKSVADATAPSGWTQGTGYTWTQTCNISDTDVEGATKIKIAGNLYKNGSTKVQESKLEVRFNYVDSNDDDQHTSYVTVGTFPSGQSLKWNYSFSKSISVSSDDMVTLKSVTYRYSLTSGDDHTANYSYPNSVKVTVTGEKGSSTSSDVCTVHYIP